MSLQWDAPGLTILSASMEVHCSHLVDPVLRIKFGAHCSHGAPGCVLTVPLEHAKHPCARASYCRVCRRDSSGSFKKGALSRYPVVGIHVILAEWTRNTAFMEDISVRIHRIVVVVVLRAHRF